MDLEPIPLRTFLEGTAAPPGTVYTWRGAPFLQLHLFESEYTVFWLGTSSPNALANGFVDSITTANAILQRTGFESERSWSVRLALFQKTDPTQRSYGLSELPIGAALPSESLAGRIEAVFSSAEPITAAYYAFATSVNNRRSIELWADTERCSVRAREVGLTSNIPLMDNALAIFSRTSFARDDVPREILTDLFKNKLQSQVSNYLTK